MNPSSGRYCLPPHVLRDPAAFAVARGCAAWCLGAGKPRGWTFSPPAHVMTGVHSGTSVRSGMRFRPRVGMRTFDASHSEFLSSHLDVAVGRFTAAPPRCRLAIDGDSSAPRLTPPPPRDDQFRRRVLARTGRFGVARRHRELMAAISTCTRSVNVSLLLPPTGISGKDERIQRQHELGIRTCMHTVTVKSDTNPVISCQPSFIVTQTRCHGAASRPSTCVWLYRLQRWGPTCGESFTRTSLRASLGIVESLCPVQAVYCLVTLRQSVDLLHKPS